MTDAPRRGRFDTEVQEATDVRDVDVALGEASETTAVLEVDDALETASALPTIDEAVDLATVTPTGTAVDEGLEGLSIDGVEGLVIDTDPDHLGVDLSVGGVDVTATVDATLGVGTATFTFSDPDASTTTYDAGLGAMPGSSLYAAEDDTSGLGDFDEEQAAKAKAEAPKEKSLWETFKSWVTPDEGADTTETKDAKAIPSTNSPWSPKKYEDPDAVVPVAEAPSDVVLQTVVTGVDPTTTTPSGPAVDDGGAEPITSDDITGGDTVVNLGVPINPGIVDDDGGLEITPTGTGDPGTFIDATSPDTIGPNDPILGGAEPITAGDITGGAGGTTANPIAGGEDEDLEDLEIQRLTPGSTPVTSSDATIDVSTDSSVLEPISLAAPLAADQELAIAGDLSDATQASALPAFEGALSVEREGVALDDGLDEGLLGRDDLDGFGGDLP